MFIILSNVMRNSRQNKVNVGFCTHLSTVITHYIHLVGNEVYSAAGLYITLHKMSSVQMKWKSSEMEKCNL